MDQTQSLIRSNARKYETGVDGRLTVYNVNDGSPLRVIPVDADEGIAMGHFTLNPDGPFGEPPAQPPSPEAIALAKAEAENAALKARLAELEPAKTPKGSRAHEPALTS